MSLDAAPQQQPEQESREAKLVRLNAEIEEAEASYNGDRSGKLRAELAAATLAPSEVELAQKYDVQRVDAPALVVKATSSAPESNVSVQPQDVASERLARSAELFAMQQAVRRGEALTKEQLHDLYFGRFYNISNMNDALEVLDLQAGNTGNKYPEKNEKLRRKANLKNLAVIFDCDNPSRQIATDFNSFANRNDVKVFVGEPTRDLVQFLEENPEVAERVNFLVEPDAMQGGSVFPLEKITLEDMKRRLGLLSALPADHFKQ